MNMRVALASTHTYRERQITSHALYVTRESNNSIASAYLLAVDPSDSEVLENKTHEGESLDNIPKTGEGSARFPPCVATSFAHLKFFTM